jgi:hypothetical protein
VVSPALGLSANSLTMVFGTDTHLKKSGILQPFSMFVVENKLSLPKVKQILKKPLSGHDKCSGCI